MSRRRCRDEERFFEEERKDWILGVGIWSEIGSSQRDFKSLLHHFVRREGCRARLKGRQRYEKNISMMSLSFFFTDFQTLYNALYLSFYRLLFVEISRAFSTRFGVSPIISICRFAPFSDLFFSW